ncbi:MAG TPA: GNAT family N-acetyltransferase [Saprospiraceae bacterium]|nr:GNAT family N-acetyltransferase [Saprospiraceae bacterium]
MASSSGLYYDYYTDCNDPVLYAAPWWLDAVCGKDKWNAVLMTDEAGAITACIPFYKTYIRSLSALITPPLTQWIPVLAKENVRSVSLAGFLDALPRCSILDLTIKPGDDPVLPAPDFRINYKYSYIIPYHVQKEQIRLTYNEGLRRNLREAEKNYSIANSDDIRSFLGLCKSSYQHRNMRPPFWLDQIVPEVVKGLQKNNCGMINLAFYRGKPISGILTGWDSKTSYYLAGGRSGDDQGASAHAMLLDHVIHEAHDRGHAFDFEGSMNPGIANFFQSFGARPGSYLQIRKFRGVGKLWSLLH